MEVWGIRRFGCLLWLGLLLVTACAHQAPSLYQWGSYQDQVYRHFKGESPGQQIQALEKDLELILASNKSVPPGMYAHMGMLYAEMSDDVKAQESLAMEKKTYPESSAYIDMLLRNRDKQKGE